MSREDNLRVLGFQSPESKTGVLGMTAFGDPGALASHLRPPTSMRGLHEAEIRQDSNPLRWVVAGVSDSTAKAIAESRDPSDPLPLIELNPRALDVMKAVELELLALDLEARETV